jgi:hypothetical protein
MDHQGHGGRCGGDRPNSVERDHAPTPETLVRTHLLSILTAGTLTALMSAAAVPATADPSSDAACPLPTFGPGAGYHPTVDAGSFTAHVDNDWFPLPVGTTFVYAGVKDGKKALDRVTPSTATRMIAGVRTRVVRDRLFIDGVLEERTSDYFAQDRCGNVWYFGEDTAELAPDGKVLDTEGTWHAGVDGAQPGVVMQAKPQLGRLFRQEWLAGQAEDVFRAVDLRAPVTVPHRTFPHALRTEESTALEPGVIDGKYYARGIGVVEELTVVGPTETLVLIDVEH